MPSPLADLMEDDYIEGEFDDPDEDDEDDFEDDEDD